MEKRYHGTLVQVLQRYKKINPALTKHSLSLKCKARELREKLQLLTDTYQDVTLYPDHVLSLSVLPKATLRKLYNEHLSNEFIKTI